jgi:hypothetical protein
MIMIMMVWAEKSLRLEGFKPEAQPDSEAAST